ncbi:MAG: exonuclease V subunit gamma, partial [Synechococcaceae cyanobacterium]|nr:exonuclease V subunit gamma [Synechococcaceae cyanobacterium]
EAAGRLTLDHPASPLDRRNFLPAAGRPPAGCDRRLLACRRLLDEGRVGPAGALLQGAMPAAAELPADGGEEPFAELRGWAMEPQRHWLRRLGLRPAEWERAVVDLEPLELGERERAALLREALDAAPGEPPDAGLVLRLCRGRGRLPPRAGAALEARLLAGRLASLQQALEALGPAVQEPVAWQGWQGQPQRRGDAVVLVHTATWAAPQAMDLWLQLLLAAAADGHPPRRGVLVARDREHPERFAARLELEAPAPDAARAELERLEALRRAWRGPCWPVPPRSGWAWLEAERHRPGSGRGKAAAVWEGAPGGRGATPERRRAEMVVCFGADLPAEELLDAAFAGRTEALYGPLLAARRGERRR